MPTIRSAVVAVGISLALAFPLWALNAPLPDWMQRVHIGGNGAIRYANGESRAQLERNGLMIYQAGLVFDVDIAPDLSFWYDVNGIREGVSRSAQQIYARWDNVFHREWLNAKIGRTFMPFGEEYLRWDAIDNPLASFTTSLPWAQDEGLLLFGDLLPANRLSQSPVKNGRFTLLAPSTVEAYKHPAVPTNARRFSVDEYFASDGNKSENLSSFDAVARRLLNADARQPATRFV